VLPVEILREAVERWCTDLDGAARLRDCRAQHGENTPNAIWNPDLPDTNDYRSQWLGVPQDDDPDNAFKIQWEMFLRHVAADEPFPHDLLEGAKGVQLAELGLRSWWERRWLEVPVIEPSLTPQEELGHASPSRRGHGGGRHRRARAVRRGGRCEARHRTVPPGASEVVSLHTPWLPETEGMIRGSHLASMKRNATLINTSRGAVVWEAEMIEVLEQRPDLWAVLDVTHPEPPEPGSRLYDLPNLVLTPHIAGSLGSECRRMGCLVVDELRRYVAGVPLEHEITRERAALMA
jgi:D-isomer specific 2-hydroxyacid dehydrogenase, NAD binding domain